MFADIGNLNTIDDVSVLALTPIEKRIAFDNTYNLLKYSAEKYGELSALKFIMQGDLSENISVIDYKTLLEKVTQTANMFHGFGVKYNEVVSYILPNLPQTHFTIWGGEATGIVNGINPFLEKQSLIEIMLAAKTKVLVTLAPAKDSDIWQKIEDILDIVPSLKTVLCIDLDAMARGTYNSSPSRADKLLYTKGGIPILDFDVEMKRCRSDILESKRHIRGTDIASYFHTGGTTGVPKLALHTHFNEVCNAWSIAAMLREGQGPQCYLSGLPMFHVNAMMVTGLAVFIAGHCSVILTPNGFRNKAVVENFWFLVERFKANFFSSVPTILTALLNVPLAGADVSTLRGAICGAASLSTQLFEQFQDYCGVKILEGYGMTEGTCVSSINPLNGDRHVGSIGIPIPYQQMKTVVIDDEGKWVRDCLPDEIGIIALKGPNVFAGYKSDDKNKNIWVAPNWFNSGDLARQDSNGYFWITGREKDLIIRGGNNIDPKVIEEVLQGHPEIALVAAIGQPDRYAGELPIAYVTLKEDGTVIPTSAQLIDYAHDHIPERAACPVHIEIINDMPITAVGKIFKPALRHLAIKRVFLALLDPIDPSVKVAVAADKTHGVLVSIISIAPQYEVDETLSGIAIQYQLKSRMVL